MTNSLQFSAIDERVLVQGPLLEFNLLRSAVLHARTLVDRGLGLPTGESIGDLEALWSALSEMKDRLPKVSFDDVPLDRCVSLVGVQTTVTAVFDLPAWRTLRASMELILTHLEDRDLHPRTGAGTNEYREIYSEVSRVIGMHREARDFLHPGRGGGHQTVDPG